MLDCSSSSAVNQTVSSITPQAGYPVHYGYELLLREKAFKGHLKFEPLYMGSSYLAVTDYFFCLSFELLFILLLTTKLMKRPKVTLCLCLFQ